MFHCFSLSVPLFLFLSPSYRVCSLLYQSLRMQLLKNYFVWAWEPLLILASCSRSATKLSKDVILLSFSSFCFMSDWTSSRNFMIICLAAIIENSANSKWRYFLISSSSLPGSWLLLPEEAQSGFPKMGIGALLQYIEVAELESKGRQVSGVRRKSFFSSFTSS